MDSNARDLFPGALEMMILESLRRQPAHGYALVQYIQQRSNDLLQVEEGSLYPALHRMEQSGWLNSEWALSESNRRAKYYTLTLAGRKQLVEAEKSWEQLMKGVQTMLRFA